MEYVGCEVHVSLIVKVEKSFSEIKMYFLSFPASKVLGALPRTLGVENL